MIEKETRIAVAPKTSIQPFRMVPTSWGEAMEMATFISQSELCPKGYRGKAQDCLLAYEFGASLGLSWMQALRSVAIINGVASLWGDAVPALILGSGECDRFHETDVGTPFEDSYAAVCTIRRKGLADEVVRSFSVADAKAAGLWGKSGPWTQYKKRMLQLRARGFATRDSFADKLSGLILAEEAQDYPDAIDATVVSSEPVAALDPYAGISEGLVESIGKGFATLNMSEAQQLVKIHEFITPADDKDAGAQALLDWQRDEFAKRKFGKPRAKSDGDNGRKKAEKVVGSASTPAAQAQQAKPVEKPAEKVEPTQPVEEEPPVTTESELF
jgi:hypothetical protein